MSFPQTIDSSLPLGTDSPAQGDDQLRGIKQYLVDVFGAPNSVAVSAPALSLTAGGLVTIAQSPLTAPAEIKGPAGQALQLTADTGAVNFVVQGASVMALTAGGLVMRQPAIEFQSGAAGKVGTQGSDALILQTAGTPRWQIDSAGSLLGSVDNTVDIGALGSQRPRNIYIASNLIVGGQIMAGTDQRILTNPDGSIGNTVTLTGDQTISGTKTFSAAPIITSTSGLLWTVGGPGYLGTTDSNTIELVTVGTSKWQVDPSGMLRATTDNLFDIGRLGDQRPRNLYVASNVIIGGMLQMGAPGTRITTPAGLLDLTRGSVPSEIQGDLLVRQTSGWDRFAPAASGFLLQTAGPGADPVWVVGSTASGVPAGQNPVNWTGGHTWAAPSFLLTNASVKAGIGTSLPTAMLHVAGSAYVASNIYLAGTPLSVASTGSYHVRGLTGVPASNTVMNLVADVVVVRNPSTGTTAIQTNTGTMQNDVTVAGSTANGRDQAGVFTASSWLHFYFIWNGSTLATLSSATAPPTGPTLPTGYTHWAYAGAVRFDGSSHLVATYLRGASAYYQAAQVLAAGFSSGSETVMDCSALVPPNAGTTVIDLSGIGGTANAGGNLQITFNILLVSGVVFKSRLLQFANGVNFTFSPGGDQVRIPNVSQQFLAQWSVSLGSASANIDVTGYTVPNGGE